MANIAFYDWILPEWLDIKHGAVWGMCETVGHELVIGHHTIMPDPCKNHLTAHALYGINIIGGNPPSKGEAQMETITIAGKPYSLNPPYTEGHTLTGAEANALNQTWMENVRNNTAKHVKDGTWGDAEVQQYASSYQFGQGGGGGGGGTRDPVRSEAMDIARQTVRDALKRAGRNLKDYKSAQISDLAERYLSGPNGEKVVEIARQRVAERQDAAASSLDELSDLVNSVQPEAAAA